MNTNRILLIASILLLLFFAWYFSVIVAYLLISLALTFLLNPLVKALDKIHIGKYHLPRWSATLISMVGFLAFVTGLVMLFLPLTIRQAELLTSIDYDALFQNLEEPISKIEDFFIKLGLSDQPNLQVKEYLQDKAIGFISFAKVGDLLNFIFGITGNFFVGFFAISFITFFFLKDESLVKRVIIGATPDAYLDKVSKVLSNSKRLLSRYFIGLFIQVSLISTLVTVGLSILGIENAFLIGLFAGIINVIPYIGPIIGFLFGMFVAITTNLDVEMATQLMPLIYKVMLVFFTVQLLDNIVFQPIIFSNSVNAHPLEIFLLIFIAGQVAGIVGMVCAIPAYTLLRIFAKEFLIQFKIVQNLTKNI